MISIGELFFSGNGKENSKLLFTVSGLMIRRMVILVLHRGYAGAI